MASRIKLYGVTWEPLLSPVTVEATMIRKGGGWKIRSGAMAGQGLIYHFKRFISLLWPEHVWHRWNELELDAYLNHRIIGEMGPASSGKTHSAAINVLADYYVWSDCTTVLVSSTEREMLEMRVWGEIKKYHQMAKDRHGDLIPGNLIESRQRIITDSRFENADGRDFRTGLVGVPCKKGGSYVGLGCFSAGTMVDTPQGAKPIEQIQVGDLVYNATGFGRVRETMLRTATKLVRVHHETGSFDCTPEHPILTYRGWMNAIDLLNTDTLISTDEAVRILQGGHADSISIKAILRSEMPGAGAISSHQESPTTNQELSNLPNQIQSSGGAAVLLNEMPKAAVAESPHAEVRTLWHPICAVLDREAFLRQVLCCEMEMEQTGEQAMVCPNRLEEGREEAQPNAAAPDRKRMASEESRNGGREDNPCAVPGSAVESDLGSSSARLYLAGHKTGGRDRRPASPLWSPSGTGQAKRSGPQTSGVVSIEILQQRGDDRCSQGHGDYQVYNLEVEGHPSYSVGGVVVHNSFAGIKNRRVRMIADECHLMHRVFVDAISNLNKNADFKCLALGNPKDTTDALGVICEPAAHLGGWDGGIDQAPKTKTWPTRFEQGICVQLVGSDSPNLDGKLGIPIIEQKSIDADIAFYGKDSLQFTMMNEGRMPRGQGLRRVITRQMCLKFGAMEGPIWKNQQRTKIASLDAAYGSVGGDRCTLLFEEFGYDPNGKQIFALTESMLVPVSVEVDEMPEEQIAKFVKAKCEERSIPPENFGFDSTGRGTLVGAFGRLWSPYVVPIEFGGNPTERPVTWLPIDQKITCRDYYSKFVSELWYSVALSIQSEQFRGMTEEVMNEGCMREWGIVGKNKIEVEPKDKMKLKTGRSPDLFDALVAGMEMARRLGFVISLIRAKDATVKDESWKKHYRDRLQKLESNHRLNYSA